MKTTKKICIIAPVHIYSDVRVFQKEAVTLADKGFEVHLISRGNGNFVENGVAVHGLHYRNRLFRFLLQPYILFKALSLKADIYHIHNPDTLIMGFLMKLLGKKVIYDTHEDFSQRLKTRKWIPKYLRGLAGFLVSGLEKAAGKVFDCVICTQEEVQKRIGNNSVIVKNYPITEGGLIDKAYELSKEIEKPDCFVAVYVGTMCMERGLIQMIEAVELLNKVTEARLWLVGKINDEDLEKVKAIDGWKYVDYFGFLPQEKAFSYIVKADVGLVLIHDVADYSQTSANKLYEYQYFGIPFIASNFEKWMKEFENCDSGIFVDPLDVTKVAEVMEFLHTDKEARLKMGESGRKRIKEMYSWESESQKLMDIYNKLL